MKRFKAPDAVMLTGAVLVFIGIWQIYEPAAFIVAGLAIAFLGYQASGGE